MPPPLTRIPNSLINGLLTIEANPIQPELPPAFERVDPEIRQFHEEATQVARKSHNQQQAGDTTFPWDLLVELTDEPLYTPGSLGRFYHESMGVILARYVKFDQMAGHAFYCVPVGRLVADSTISWTVTNDLSKSSAFAVVGFAAATTHPVDGQYGWAVVSGPNLSSVQTLDETLTAKDGLAWSATGQVSAVAAGRVIARKIGGGADTLLDPGELFIDIESYSAGAIQDMLAAQFSTIDLALTNLSQRVTAFEAGGGADFDPTVLTASIARLRGDLNLEAQTRVAQDNAINARFAGLVTQTMLNTAVSGLATSISLSVVSATASQAYNKAEAALIALAPFESFDPSALQSAITALTTQVNSLSAESISFTPAGGITSVKVQAALVELDTLKFDKAGGVISGLLSVNGFEPETDDASYLGKNDDDSPKAWKGLIMRDQTTGTYYRLEINSGAVTLTDLTD